MAALLPLPYSGLLLRGPNFAATLLKWPLAKISAIAKFARQEADFHWILCQENAWKYKNFSRPAASRTNFAKNLDLAHITR